MEGGGRSRLGAVGRREGHERRRREWEEGEGRISY
jgi:hypothetical protein